MTPEFVTSFFLQAIKTAILLATPMLVVGLVTGVIVSMFQAATQINEMTMVFVPKMLGVALALLFFFPWMMKTIVGFTQNLFLNLPNYIR
ncbi:flagellar biosynthetic protein FliQ [Desulfosarcina ovata subsp. sediminis]|uniref:Flagellar biosynthetic protein FliQ n=1 Tax=Desulfosarcina ovata subsp. sediminis TaxID=885957 RepID=A0A5K7ZIL6_9BACT|nr:flagellar biosynthesis protein FliQ [Desulfosarcina ovata]BBO79807.1 flagellar biosynthetic protein FliQ [Desulfosarcina ovata subsp. sediminis]